jgi:hypothetical protein
MSSNPVLRDPANPEAAKFVNGVNGNEYLPGKEVFPIPFGTMMTSFANDFAQAHHGPANAFFLQNLQAIISDWDGGFIPEQSAQQPTVGFSWQPLAFYRVANGLAADDTRPQLTWYPRWDKHSRER